MRVRHVLIPRESNTALAITFILKQEDSVWVFFFLTLNKDSFKNANKSKLEPLDIDSKLRVHRKSKYSYIYNSVLIVN